MARKMLWPWKRISSQELETSQLFLYHTFSMTFCSILTGPLSQSVWHIGKRGQGWLPNRRSAGSMLLGLLVAAMTITCALCFSPSMRVSSWDTMRRSTSPCVCGDRKQRWDQQPHKEHSSQLCIPAGAYNSHKMVTNVTNCIWLSSCPTEFRG